MCTFLMKMREYYRWENELPYSDNLPRKEVGDWLVQREKDWEKLEGDDFSPLPLSETSETVDPFDMDRANKLLIPMGYVYSSGYGIFNKPLFYLGKLDKKESHEGATLFISSCEYARDLVAPPAMSRGGKIFIRGESVKRFVWERLEEWRWGKQKEGPLPKALDELGQSSDADQQLNSLSTLQTEIMVQHELGELSIGKRLGKRWEQLLSRTAGTKAEFIMRGLRDNLADCIRTVPYLLSLSSPASLHLYFSNFSGLRRHLFPGLREAYESWCQDGSMVKLDRAVRLGESQFCRQTEQLLELDFDNKSKLSGKIDTLAQPVELR